MKDYSSWTLKGLDPFNGELIFDETEMSIQRNLKSYWMFVFIAFWTMLTMVGNILNSYEKGRFILFYIFLFIEIVLFFILIYAILRLLTARKKNNRVYSISEIKSVYAEIKNYRAWITIEFKDETFDKIPIIKNNYYSIFIEVMKKNSIDVIENNKR
jgi:hypothetical protein